MRIPTRLDPCVITQGFHDAHHAVDLRAFMHDPVFAPEDAMVTRVFVDPNGNHAVYLEGISGMEYRLFHATSVAGIIPRARIAEGSAVGRIVLDPGSTGTHLHFEVLSAGRLIQNPIRWMLQHGIAYSWKAGIPRQGEADEATV